MASSKPHDVSETRREYPAVPRVGVGVVVMRERADGRTEVVIVKRGRAPEKGSRWATEDTQ